MHTLDPETVQREAATLRALLETLIPEYLATRAEVTLAPDAPALVRAFWDIVGYSTAFRPFVQSPEEAWGAAELEQILRGWEKPVPVREVGLLDRVRDRLARGVFATAQRAPAPVAASRVDRARLPRKLRFVGVSDLWDHCFVTDEDAPADDPPVVRIDRTPFGVRRAHASYLRRTAHALLQKAFIVNGCGLRFDPPLAGEPLLPALAPHVTRVADGIWRLARPEVPDETEHRGAGEKVGFASFDRLAEWMHDEAPPTLTAMSGTNGSFLPLKPELKDTVLRVGRLRRFEYRRNGARQIELVGWIDGMPAWITPDPETEEMHGVSVSAANREGMLAWIERETKG
ncbi:MAG: hypothetical protein WCJ30_04680 [Deltaproteobacteria bacterium]